MEKDHPKQSTANSEIRHILKSFIVKVPSVKLLKSFIMKHQNWETLAFHQQQLSTTSGTAESGHGLGTRWRYRCWLCLKRCHLISVLNILITHCKQCKVWSSLDEHFQESCNAQCQRPSNRHIGNRPFHATLFSWKRQLNWSVFSAYQNKPAGQ